MVKVCKVDTGDNIDVDVALDLSASELKKEIAKRFGASNNFGNNVVMDGKGSIWVFSDDMSKGNSVPPRFTQPQALDSLVEEVDLSVNASWDPQMKIQAFERHVDYMRKVCSVAQERVEQARSTLEQSARQQLAIQIRSDKLREQTSDLQNKSLNLRKILGPLLATVESCNTAELTKGLAGCFTTADRRTLFDFLGAHDLPEVFKKLSNLLTFIKNSISELPSNMDTLQAEVDTMVSELKQIVAAAVKPEQLNIVIQLADKQAAITARHEIMLGKMTSALAGSRSSAENMLSQFSSLDIMLEWNNSNWMEDLRHNDELLREELWKTSEAKYSFATDLYEWTAKMAKLESKLSNLTSKVMVYTDLIGKNDFTKIQRAQALPKAYSCSLRETVRRREFKQQLVSDIVSINASLTQRVEEEVAIRKKFCDENPLGEMAVGSLFPGLFDPKLPQVQVQFSNFDTLLPAVGPHEIEADTWEVLDQDDFRAVMNRQNNLTENSIMLSSQSLSGVSNSVRQALVAAGVVDTSIVANESRQIPLAAPMHTEDEFSDSEDSVDVEDGKTSEEISRLRQIVDEQKSTYEDKIRDLERKLTESVNLVAASISAKHHILIDDVLSPKACEPESNDFDCEDAASSLTPLPEDRELLLQKEKERLEIEISNSQHIIDALSRELEALKQDNQLLEAEKMGMEEQVRLCDCRAEDTKTQLEEVILSYEKQLESLSEQYVSLRNENDELATANEDQEAIMNARHRELQSLNAELSSTRESLEKTTSELLASEDHNDELISKVAQLKTQTDELQTQIDCLSQVNESLKQHIEELTTQTSQALATTQKNEQSFEDQIMTLKQLLDTHATRVAELQTTVQCIAEERDTALAENVELKTRLSTMETVQSTREEEKNIMVSRLGELAAKCANTEAVNDELNDKVEELSTQYSECKEERNHLLVKVDLLSEECAELETEKQSLADNNEELTDEIAAVKQRIEEEVTKLEYEVKLHADTQLQLQFTQGELMKVKRSFQQSQSDAQLQIEDLRKQLAETNDELAHAKASLGEQEAASNAITSDLDAALELVSQLESRTEKLENQLRVALEASEKSEADYKKEIEELIVKHVAELSDYERNMQDLKKQLITARDAHEQDAEKWKLTHTDMEEAHKSRAGNLQEHIDDLKERIEVAEEAKAQIQTLLKTRSTELDAKIEQNQVLSHTIKAMTDSSKTAHAKLDAVKEQLLLTEARLLDIETNNASLKEKLAGSEANCLTLGATITSLSSEVDSLKSNVRLQQERVAMLQTHLSRSEDERRQVEDELQLKLTELENQERENEGLTLTTKQMSEAAKAWNLARAVLEGEIANLTKIAQEKDEAIRDLASNLKTAQDNIIELESDISQNQIDIDTVVEHKERVEAEKELLTAELSKLKAACETQLKQRKEDEAVIQALQDELQEQAKEVAHHRDVNSELKEKLRAVMTADTDNQKASASQIEDLTAKLQGALNTVTSLEKVLALKQAEYLKKEKAVDVLNQTMKDLIARFRQTSASSSIIINTPPTSPAPQTVLSAGFLSAAPPSAYSSASSPSTSAVENASEAAHLRCELETVKQRAKQTESQLYSAVKESSTHRASLDVCVEVLSELAARTDNLELLTVLDLARQGNKMLIKSDIAKLLVDIDRLHADTNELKLSATALQLKPHEAKVTLHVANYTLQVNDTAIFHRVDTNRWEMLFSSEAPTTARYFLSDETVFALRDREFKAKFVCGTVFYVTSHTATADFNPFNLALDTPFHTVDLFPEFSLQ